MVTQIQLSEIEVGDYLQLQDGSYIEVTNVRKTKIFAPMKVHDAVEISWIVQGATHKAIGYARSLVNKGN